MSGTYALQGIGAGHTGHVYTLHREEIERLIGSRTDGPYRITNLVTRKSVKVSDSRPLTAADLARISNDEVAR
jgi:hypothetical protein